MTHPREVVQPRQCIILTRPTVVVDLDMVIDFGARPAVGDKVPRPVVMDCELRPCKIVVVVLICPKRLTPGPGHDHQARRA
jgi:hypothetical protein